MAQSGKEKSAKWRKLHPESDRERSARWRKLHPESIYKYNHSESKRLSNARYRRKNPQKHSMRNMKWAKDNPEKTHAARSRWRRTHPEYYVKYSEGLSGTQREKQRNNKKRWKHANPEKIRAYRITNRAKIPMIECIGCGSIKNLHRHHPDYNKPLEVVVLCSKGIGNCHFKEHIFGKETGHLHSMDWWVQYAKEHQRLVSV